MENIEVLTKKNLKRRLSGIMIVYMDGLSKKKQARLEKYLETKLNDVVGYYMGLLKPKKKKVMIIKPLLNPIDEKESVVEIQIS